MWKEPIKESGPAGAAGAAGVVPDAGTTSLSTTHYTATLASPNPLTSGYAFLVKFNATNLAASDIALSSGTAQPLYSNGAALPAGAIVAGCPYLCRSNGTQVEVLGIVPCMHDANYNNINGNGAGVNITTGSNNNINGNLAGAHLTTGIGNNLNGYGAGFFLTTGGHNNLNGYQAGLYMTTGGYNNLNGYQAGWNMTTGSNNNITGYRAGAEVTTGIGNTIHGYRNSAASIGEVTSGNYNTSIGYDCAVPSPTTDNQLCIANQIYGTGLDGRGATVGGGKIGIGTKTPSTTLDVAGITTTTELIVATSTPTSAAATGAVGTIAWDASYLYVCTATNTWKRVAIATW